MQVIKRNGNTEDFNINKIVNAVRNAMESTKYNGEVEATNVAELVLEKLTDKDTFKIEEIQDVVENTLMNLNLCDVAKSYVIYREERKNIRNFRSSVYENIEDKIKDIMSMKGIENSNANVDEASFSGKNNKVMASILKEYALNNLINKKAAQYHREGRLYTHDLDNWATGMHNCLTINFEKLFSENGGFSTRNGDVRKPNDIMTFMQLVAVVFQCESQVQYGGVSSNKIDYDGAPYVAITFRKAFKNALMDRLDKTEEEAKQIIEEDFDIIRLGNAECKEKYGRVYEIAEKRTEEKTMQACEGLYHNLNTLESRPGRVCA